uniref:GCR048 n=1 Tax=Schmidtea mediterranea TaxID=79327 RepID=A0A193KU82_SCHMD|nr:GCR048 [Schmidtea mediterranea]
MGSLIENLIQAIYFGEFYLPLLIMFLGIPGNILSFLVMVQKQNRNKSTGVYMAGLAIFDFLVLIISLFLYWLFFNFFQNTDFQWACSVFRFLVQFLTQVSTYYIVARTFDRFLSICFPLKTRNFSTSSVALKIITLIPVLLFFINMHGFWTYKLLDVAGLNQKKCVFVSSSSEAVIFMFWELTLTTLFPFLTLIILNIGIIIRLHQKQDGVGETVDQNKRNAVQNQITRSLLLVSFMFLVLNMPYRADDLIWRYVAYENLSTLFYIRRVSYVYLHKVWYCHNAVNFYLYVLSGKKFRNEVKSLFKSDKKRLDYTKTSNVK